MANDVTDRLVEAMQGEGLDALVLLSPEAFAHGAGFVVPSHPLMRWRHAALVVTSDGREGLLCVGMEETTVRGLRPDALVRSWPEFTGDPMVTLAGLLAELGLAGARIGVELGFLSVADHARLAPLLPDATLVPAEPLLSRVRQVKTPSELALHRRLARAADTAIRSAFDGVRAGDTEMDIAAGLTGSLYAQGIGQYKLMIVATGERSELPNVGPTPRVLAPGDICRVEIFAVDRGYHAGVCRTAVVGEASEVARRVYANLADCRRLVLDGMRPGALAHEVYDTFRARFDELGMPAISFVGHSIGVDLHETPYLAADVKQPLEAGMVFGIEPLVYRSGHGFGMQIKDIVAVGPDGADVLSDATPTDVLYPVEA